MILKLFSGFENPFTVFHWHGDTFDLPEGATKISTHLNTIKIKHFNTKVQ